MLVFVVLSGIVRSVTGADPEEMLTGEMFVFVLGIFTAGTQGYWPCFSSGLREHARS